MTRQILAVVVLLAILAAAAPGQSQPANVTVGSKKFTESVILGEIITELGENAGCRVVHRRELGGTQILWQALLRGDVDIYPEYTGTITAEILAASHITDEDALRAGLAERGVIMSRSLGFDDTYALGMREFVAEQRGIRTISDLRDHPELRLGFSNEFMDRADGWPSLQRRYRLPQQPSGVDHDLAYRAVASGAIDVTDLYSTDAEIRYFHLRVLDDDLGQFPKYQAVWLYRADLVDRAPEFVAQGLQLEGRISAAEMTELNAQAKLGRIPEERVAADFLAAHLGIAARVRVMSLPSRLLKLTAEHLQLVGVSLLAAILLALPLGILAARRPALGQLILALSGIIQTIPSLALLVFMIPLLGIGTPTAIVALFLYSLLPIVRNTYTGLRDIPPPIRESAAALGLPARTQLWRIELPLASRSILAGIKTSAVLNVGTATLGALIGAGGYGQPILTGIRLADTGLILQGAIPAALLALATQGLFEWLDRLIVPEGLRLKAEGTPS